MFSKIKYKKQILKDIGLDPLLETKYKKAIIRKSKGN